MNRNIFKPEVQQFLKKHIKDDVSRFALSKIPFTDVSSAELAEQLDGKQRTEKKLPLWFNTEGIIFPPKISVEQSSSEHTALYKSKLLKGNTLIDLTGGFGVDTFFFSRVAEHVIHCEQNEDLSAVAKHNLTTLGANNVEFITEDSIKYLQVTDKKFDTIYVDPSRRIQSKKVFLLEDTEPDVVSNLDLLLSKAQRIIIKTSPLFDIQSGLNDLKHVSEVHVLSVRNDCKELLWVIDKDFTGEAQIICTAIGAITKQSFSFKLSEEKKLNMESYSEPLKYLYEPDVALLKAGCFKQICKAFEVEKLHQNTHLYTSENIAEGFIGKTFQINSVVDYKIFMKENLVKKANVISKNFPLKPEELKKRHKLSDGGKEFLFFSTVFPNKLQVTYASLLI